MEYVGLEKSLKCYGVGVIECNRNGDISASYGGLMDIFDLSRIYKNNDDLIGKNLFDIVLFEDFNLKIANKSKTIMIDVNAKTLRGRSKTYSICIVDIGDSNLHIAFRDITNRKEDQKEIEESNRRYKTIVNIAPIGIIVVNSKTNIKEFNNYFAAMIGTQHPEKFINRPINEITGLSETGLIKELKEVIKTGMAASNQVQFLSQYGKTSNFTYIITPIKDNEIITGAFLLIEDSSRSK